MAGDTRLIGAAQPAQLRGAAAPQRLHPPSAFLENRQF
jgi:hypothetical protein